MNAMLLAAGLGTRLRSLGLDVPKALVEVGDEPLLGRQLRYLGRQGAGRVVVNAHHMADQVQQFLAGFDAPVETVLLHEPELLGTAGGVRNALEQLGPEAFLVLYGDVVVAEDLGEMVAAHRRRDAAATLAVYETSEVEGKGTVEVDSDDRVRAFREKGGSVSVPALVNAGVYLVEPSLVAGLPPGQPSDFGYDVFPAAVARGERILVHRLARPVIDVGTPSGLRAARALAQGEQPPG